MNIYAQKTLPVSLTVCALMIGAASGVSASPREGRITQATQNVQLIGTNASPRPASVNDSVSEGTSIRTGAESRAEITFADKTIARLGSNTVFTFDRGRTLRLDEGLMLLQAPRRARGAKIQMKELSAAVAGTTTLVEYHPNSYKFLVLAGTGRLYRPNHLGDSMLVLPGQMVIADPKTGLSSPVDFDIGRFVKTCRFLIDFPPLASHASIAAESQKQEKQKSKKVLIDTNLVIFGEGAVVSLTQPTSAISMEQTKAAPTVPVPAANPPSSDLGTIETPPLRPPVDRRPVPLPVPTPIIPMNSQLTNGR